MKKEVMGKSILILMVFIFLLYGVSAAYGDCRIVERNACVAADGNYIIMGLSSQTNAHGEFPDQGTYPYVLCCGLPQTTGDITCSSGIFPNKIIGLSSNTNAHAESPTQSNYLTKVCYEDFSCISTSSNCGTGEAASFPLGVLSLSSLTNAHIGNYSGEGSYSTKVCCAGASIGYELSCDLESATWNLENAIEGQKVRLEVTGSGLECDDASISFEVREADVGSYNDVSVNPSNVAFNGNTATGVWYAEWQDDGIFGGNPEYYFIATIKGTSKSITSTDPKLKVTETEITDYCSSITTCDDYSNEEECESDESLCEVAEDSGAGLVDCDEDSIVCGCGWNDDESTCEFGWNEITDCGNPEDGCNYGCTLCNDQTSEEDYCNLGSTCPSGDEPTCNDDGVCDSGEGCLCENDCFDGDQDTCSSDTYCSSGKCFSIEGVPLTIGSCKITQVIEKECDEEPTGYKIISWTGEWTGEQSGEAYEKCVAGGKSTVPCPAQIQLPFFDYTEMIITLVVIAGIYISLILKKRFCKEKKIKKK